MHNRQLRERLGLSILSKIALWNTIYLQQVVHMLPAERIEIREEKLTRLSPACFEHINRLDKHTFPR